MVPGQFIQRLGCIVLSSANVSHLIVVFAPFVDRLPNRCLRFTQAQAVRHAFLSTIKGEDMKKKNWQHLRNRSFYMTAGAFATASLFGAVMALVTATAAASDTVNSDSAARRLSQDSNYAIVTLKGDPLSTYSKTKPPKGKKIDFNSNIVKSYRAQLSALRNDYKQWLHANYPNVKVTGEYDIALNAVAVQLNGTTLSQVATSPLVAQANYQGLYYPVDADPDLGLIHAMDAWEQGGGAADAGAGVKIAIIDSGIDITHPCFSDAGYPAQAQSGDRRFTNNKVIVAKVFNNRTPTAGYTAQAFGAHGTHVSGTVACNYATPAKVDGVTIPYAISGVAPRALLGNYNVFPGNVDNARSEDIFNAMEAAYRDGFDIVNMSLGGGQHGELDLDTQAANNLDQANMVVAIANGNSGPGYGTVESPGSAARALSAGAASVGHNVVTIITSGGQSFQSVKGDFGNVPAGGLTAPLSVVLDPSSPFGGLSQLCSSATAGSLTGTIALISRGTCDFTVKLRNAQAAGAVGAIVVNREAGDPSVMGQNGDANQPTIPGYMVGLADRSVLMAKNGAATTIPPLGTYVYSAAGNDIMASFSSWGPTAVDYRVKPDVVAPGVNILSSVPASACSAPPCFAFYNGTSMATPHLAGSAAVLRAVHPAWSSTDIRSAIVNTAVRGTLRAVDGSVVADVNIAGAGREDLGKAANAFVTLDPVSVSFGVVPSGSSQRRSVDVALHNVSGGYKTFSLSMSGGDASVGFNVNPASVTLAPDASATVHITMNAVQGAAAGNHQGFLEISSGGAEVAHAAVLTLVK
jgi:subtilisin family serine protease